LAINKYILQLSTGASGLSDCYHGVGSKFYWPIIDSGGQRCRV